MTSQVMRTLYRVDGRRVLLAPGSGQVIPGWIRLFDQGDLLVASPALDLLFSGDGGSRFVEHLVVHEADCPVLLRESAAFTGGMLVYSVRKVTCDSNVKPSIPACQDVDVEPSVVPLALHLFSLATVEDYQRRKIYKQVPRCPGGLFGMTSNASGFGTSRRIENLISAERRKIYNQVPRRPGGLLGMTSPIGPFYTI